MAKASLKKTRIKRLPKAPNGGIELLLIQSVDHLGKQGDVVDGQARLRDELSAAARPGHDCHRPSQADGR